MKYHWDLTQAEPILHDYPIYSAAAVPKGTPVCAGAIATNENCGRVIVATGGTLQNIVGVTNEDVTAANALGVIATGVENYCKVIINPFAVWLTKYSKAAAYDIAVTTADSTGKSLTAADTGDQDQCHYWAYVTNVGGSNNGFGNLFCVGADGGGTTALTAMTSYDDNLLGNAIGDTFILMHAPLAQSVASGSTDLITSTTEETLISGQVAGSGTGAAQVLELFIESKYRPMEPLVVSRHSGYNYKVEDPNFYADVYMCEHLFGAGGGDNARPIT